MTTTTAARPSQQERSARSTALLLDAAGDLIAEGGYAAMTLAAVGARAGYSRGLVTARFGSKDKLLEALVGRIVHGCSHHNVLRYSGSRSGREAVVVLLDTIRAQAERDQRASRVLCALMHEALGNKSQLRDEFVRFHRAVRAELARLVTRGLRDGSVRAGIPADEEASLIVAGLRGIAYQWALDPATFELPPALAYLVATTEERLHP